MNLSGNSPYLQVEPDANRDMVTKKINSLRSSYRKEKKKVQDSERSGACADDVYKPSLWYYNLLIFLDDQDNQNFDNSVSQVCFLLCRLLENNGCLIYPINRDSFSDIANNSS